MATAARKVGKVYHQLGFLPSAEVVEISAHDLVTEPLTAHQKIAESLTISRGKVLFISDADLLLNPNQGGERDKQVVVNEIARSMSSLATQSRVLILASQSERLIDEMLVVGNQRLRSKMTKKIRFPNFETRRLTQLLVSVLERKGFELSPSALGELPMLVDRLSLRQDLSRAHDLENLASDAMSFAANMTTISPQALRAAFNRRLW
jgi:hypothetical protein